MSDPWNSQVDAMADTIEQMVRSGKGEVSDFRNTANDTIAKVGGALPENVRQALHHRLNSRLDMLENEINSRIDQAATIVSEESKEALDGAMMKFIQTLKGLPVDDLTQLFSLVDKDMDGTINQEEFAAFVATTLPPGTVIPPAAIALGFQVLDTDRTGSLSISDILGTQGEIITTAAKIVSEEIKEEPTEQIETPPPEEMEPQQEIIQEEVRQEEINHENYEPLDSDSISSKLSEARFSSEKTKIVESLKGNPVEFDVSINRVRSEGSTNKPMEVEVSASDGSNYIISIDSSKISTIHDLLEKRTGTVRIKGSVLGFNMARNCVTIDISQIE